MPLQRDWPLGVNRDDPNPWDLEAIKDKTSKIKVTNSTVSAVM
jgi:hypothetical protein